MLGKIPPITRVLLLCILGVSFIGSHCAGLYSLHYDYHLIFVEKQYYRLFTSIFCVGKLNMLSSIKIYMLFRFSAKLEDDCFRSKSADYFLFILILLSLTLLTSFMVELPFTFQCLCSTLICIWAKKNLKQSISLFGLINFRAPYLPYIFLIVNIIVGGNFIVKSSIAEAWYEQRQFFNKNIIYELFGVIVGHIYYYFYFVVPKLPYTRDISILSSPQLLCKITDWLGLDSKRELILEAGDFIDDEALLERIQNNQLQL
ncbi:unnamed protein product [Moneuplotes crassus]|uniref:Derlin n=1 Tax=Euplotes crassus TaxID=5936 RepID=A0AAD1XK47_EUPCR|nr:unnamed protein product [Moneuplotes crassus]